ncbi:5-oxoprolinase subunit B family protein [Negadavirga shengliensis]|uniref:Allophanate hydrolase subunit 1 n=1 Tax=Negadavirga shengliensis TaxID=1389218 RepID=A0ABV9T001_9BACT
MTEKIKITNTGPLIVELVWPATTDENILMEMVCCKRSLQKHYKGKLQSITGGYHILGLHFKLPQKIKEITNEIKHILGKLTLPDSPQRTCWEIPVCYDKALAPDLETYLKKKKLEYNEFVSMHSGKRYLLHFFGFLPGFMYLGGLDKNLFCPRKPVPSRVIAKGTVAIGGSQTGIYPADSPGGWYALGKTPVEIFAPRKNIFPGFSPGDLIQFKPIDRKTFDELKENPDLKIKRDKPDG